MNKHPGFDLIERARALAPLIAREADEIERTRRLTEPVVSALIENGLYRVLLPQSLGGTEAPPEIFMQMLEEVAKADASTAWCLGQCSVCAMTPAYLYPDAAKEIFGKPSSILAWGAINHEVQVVPGGYRATARWDFASGSRQATWLGAHVRIVEADGTTRLKPGGAPEVRTILFPVSSATMHDVWDVIGLNGTGTDSYSVDNLFIPEKFAALRDDPTGGLGGRCRLSHGGRHRRIPRQQVRTPFSRHARDRATGPGPQRPLRRRRQGDPGQQFRAAGKGPLKPVRRRGDIGNILPQYSLLSGILRTLPLAELRHPHVQTSIDRSPPDPGDHADRRGGLRRARDLFDYSAAFADAARARPAAQAAI